jgi:hypothetical protein
MLYNGNMNSLPDKLNRKFLEWQMERGKPQSQKAFAEWLGVKPTTYSGWAAGLPPDDEGMKKLESKWGPVVWLWVGKLPPDIRERTQSTTPERQAELLDLIADFLERAGAAKEL